MNYKGIIIAGAIAIGVYLFSQGKSIFSAAAPQTTGQRTAQKVSQKVDISRLPVAQIRYMIAHAAAQKKTGKEVAALKAEVARREAAWKAAVRKAAAQKIAQKIAQKVAQKVAPKRIGQPTTQAARIAALRKAVARKAAVRKAAAQQIGKIIGKKVAQKIPLSVKARRAVIDWYAKRQRPQIQRPKPNKKQVVSWKAPYRFPNKKFRVITPSDLLKNLAKKDIARKKAEQQKTAQKTTPSTPSDRRKKRLKALYGSHWHDIWVQRQRR